MRGADDQVHGKGSAQCQPNLVCFAPLAPRRHDDEEIHVAIDLGFAIREGAEQDDLVGMKLPGDGAGVTPDYAHRNVRRPVMPNGGKRKFILRSFGHDIILTKVLAIQLPFRCQF